MVVSGWPQSRWGDPDEDRQARQTKCAFSTPPRKERQGQDRGLDVGSQQDSPRLQRTFRRLCMAVSKSGFLDGACDKHTYDGLRHPSYDCERTGRK